LEPETALVTVSMWVQVSAPAKAVGTAKALEVRLVVELEPAKALVRALTSVKW
jgi:hypothetical protein